MSRRFFPPLILAVALVLLVVLLGSAGKTKPTVGAPTAPDAPQTAPVALGCTLDQQEYLGHLVVARGNPDAAGDMIPFFYNDVYLYACPGQSVVFIQFPPGDEK